MAKTKRRTNRKLKRSVRRTLGALCMITAIIVAAIPFPDARAEQVEPIETTEENFTYTVDLAYDDGMIQKETEDDDLTFINNLTVPAKPKEAYIVEQREGGWLYYKVYDYFIPENNSNNGIISKYHDIYAKDTFTITSSVWSDYFVIKDNQYNDYLEGVDAVKLQISEGLELIVTGAMTPYIAENNVEPESDPNKNFFSKYTPAEWQKYTDQYAEYQTKYSKYLEDKAAYEQYLVDKVTNPDIEPVSNPIEPEKPTLTIIPKNRLDNEQLKAFFCEKAFKESNNNFTLVTVKTYDLASDKWINAYMPRVAEGAESFPGYEIDANRFMCKTFDQINGIYKNAFEGVSNVKELVISGEIKYIGDAAFKDSNFLRKVELNTGTNIGNQAFAGGNELEEVIIPGGCKTIGAEAFKECGLKTVTIPPSVTRIGDGAFAFCTNLESLIYAGDMPNGGRIGDYAFFDCIKLGVINFGEAKVNEIGKAAFALKTVDNSALTEFTFPKYMDGMPISGSTPSMGDCILAGRINLRRVNMPTNYGTDVGGVTVPTNTFYGCENLECVSFADNSKNVILDPKAFCTVMNQSFYVTGPGFAPGSATTPSMTRQNVWSCFFMKNTKTFVPYVYSDSDGKHSEVSDSNGKFVMEVGEDGIINNCFFKDLDNIPSGDIELPIKDQIGGIKIVGFGDNCLGSKEDTTSVLNTITKLVIGDDSNITSIGNEVFSGAQKLTKVDLGDSITSIGDECFSGCKQLAEVTLGSNIATIGDKAFYGCDKVTLMKFDIPEAVTDMTIGTDAFTTQGSQLTIEGLIDKDYAPFKWAMDPECFMDSDKGIRVLYRSPAPTSLSVILDNKNNMPTLVDYPHYGDLGFNPETLDTLTTEQTNLVYSCLNIVVPSGVKSVDSKGYFNNSSETADGSVVNNGLNNDASIKTYFSSGVHIDDYKQHGLFRGMFTEGTTPEENHQGNDRIQTIKFTDVEYLPDGCFYSCENLETVDLGNGMKDVGSVPFEFCTKLTSIGGNSLYTYNNGILYKNDTDGTKTLVECLASRGSAEGVGEMSISAETDPDLTSVDEIESGAFRNCKEITSVNLEGASGLKAIPTECFKDDKILNSAVLPANVTFIGNEAFSGVNSGFILTVKGSNAILGNDVFKDTTKPQLFAPQDAPILQQAKNEGVTTQPLKDTQVDVVFKSMKNGKMETISTVPVEKGESARGFAPFEDDLKDAGFIKDGYKLYGWVGEDEVTKQSVDIKDEIQNETTFYATIAPIEGEDTDGDGIPDIPSTGNDSNNNNDNNNQGNNGNQGDNNNQGNNNQDGTSSDKDDDDDDDDDKKKHTLTVVYGNGSGTYKKGATVIISAIEPPAGKEFYKWTTTNTGLTITSATSAATTVKMTDSDATVTATYRDKSSVSGNSSKPISKKENPATEVQITKPGISSTDKAYASVKGSTDNFVVKITESAEAANAVATALAYEYADMEPIKYFAMDISLYDKKGNKVTNTNGLSVDITMPIPDQLVQYGGNNKVGAVVNNSTLEKLNCKFTTVSGVPCVTFTATHFSPYTIYVDTSNLSANVIDSSPKTGDGIHPKWFLSLGLACLSIVLFMKKDKVTSRKVVA